ncbi:MAG: peptidoglycan DD-metalloendopeptidase family protein [Candidatus Nanopelagicales bacterium]
MSRRGRWAAGIAAGSAAALAVGALALVPAAGTNAAGWSEAQSPFASPADSPAPTSAARTSASLSRGLAAQSRLFTEASRSRSTLPAPAAPAAAAATTKKPAATKKAAKPALAMKPGNGPLWDRLPVLELGAEGKAVAFLQFKLHTKKTGFYGPLTLAAVTKYQESRGLPAKGYVGPLTWRAILTNAAPVAAETASASGSSRSTTYSRSVVRAPVTAGKVCPAPGAAFGSGWGAQRAGHLHQGVDLVASRGTPILAVESGYILRAGVQSNGAIRIVQQGGSGAKYFYGHMDRITVGAGSRVSRGQVIGYMGDTGSPGAVHLHFEYWPSGRESAAVDPYPLLKSLCW